MAQYKVIHKSDVFTLILKQLSKHKKQYQILVNLTAQEYLTPELSTEIREAFTTAFSTPHNQTRFCWVIKEEHDAKALYNWVNVIWPKIPNE